MDRETFLARATHRRKPVKVPDVGTIHVRELSAAESHDLHRRGQKSGADELDLLALATVRVACDEDGRPIFTDDDVPALRSLPLRVLKQITDAAAELSEIRGGDDAGKKPAAD